MSKVLIVDDEPLARARLGALLRELNQVEVVGEASDAREALVLLEKLSPDILYLDVRMPGMSGLELARRRPRRPWLRRGGMLEMQLSRPSWRGRFQAWAKTS
jgi:two-component system response regulator AlgR